MHDASPEDPPFLFAMLVAARRAGDRTLESLTRAWLAEFGIRVRFTRAVPPDSTGKEVKGVG